MFTGLVRAVATVAAVDKHDAGLRLTLTPPEQALWDLPTPSPGDSIAIDGCCLTLAEEPTATSWAFDAVPQTLAVTSLGTIAAGVRVNVEPSLRAGDELGGHIVQGHVDGLAEVVSVKTDGEWRVRLRAPEDLRPMIVPKGSVCLAGVSLTIAAVDQVEGWFEVVLIPTTLRETNLDALAPGQRINIETDVFARTIVQYLRHFAGPASLGR